jgi:endothelin-converting enzyme/putative endopeptidase
MRKAAWLLLVLPFAVAAKKPASAPPSLGIDETAIDPAIDPCDDFFQYACGNWIKRTEIPADRARWVRSLSVLTEENETRLRKILDALAAGKGTDKTAFGDKLAAYYGSCMDEAGIEKTAEPQLKDLLKPIDAIKDLPSLEKVLAELHLGVDNALFAFGSQQDFKDATRMIGIADQAGLGMPDRDYYLKDDPRFKEYRAKYVEHVTNMLTLAGVADASKKAHIILALETKLARASMPLAERRDPNKIYHRLEIAGLMQLAPKFPWKQYLADLGFPSITQINVAVPEFFRAINGELTATPLADWKTYLTWHAIHGLAPGLSKRFVDENFNFYGKTLTGTAQILPRWKRCVESTDDALGEALGQPFVAQYFGAEGKASTLAMVRTVEGAMERDLGDLSWMDDATRKRAIEKLHLIANQIGYPDQWRNYDKLDVTRDAYVMNRVRASTFETHRQLAKIGQPVDRGEWEMTPPMVNAYYTPQLNKMVFPAGILQAPFFSRTAVPAVNYGAIGMVMGHELTHGFDDEGRQFDGKGNLADWWTPSVGKEFDTRAACVASQFDGYTVLGDVHLNGKLTLGENIADLGGLKLAHSAYRAANPEPKKLGKFTDDQLFYLGYAQAWCGKTRDDDARRRASVDPHAPPEYRVNGPLSNLSEFAHAFSCKAGAKMVRQNACVVW